MSTPDLKQMATALRILSADMIENAKSGHPGAPLGLADIVTILWSKFLHFDAAAPDWPNRDRFILSGGHASALLYSLLYLTGNRDTTLDEIKRFRQLGSKTAGHPEKTLIEGIDFSTGPLGQGLGGAVGMALAERMMNARFGDNLVNHRTYVTCGDGDLMEGVSEEILELAGLWNLNKLIVLWDDNHITIDGRTDISTATRIKDRFGASNWLILECDGHNFASIENALEKAQTADKPVLIDCHTIIGYGAPTKSNTPACHGAPLGADEIAGLRQNLNWPYEPFEIPESILGDWRAVGAKGEGDRLQWETRLAHDEHKNDFLNALSGNLPADLSKKMQQYKADLVAQKEKLATRKASKNALAVLSAELPNLICGSADLAGACFTKPTDARSISRHNYAGNYINYGIRELGMGTIMNGLAAYGGFLPLSSTFLSFSDYVKPALRLGALMNLQEIFVFTHDSLGVGEDGPTHQPIEQLAMLRAIPNTWVFRPADSVETAECYETALLFRDKISVLALSRQSLPVLRTDISENRSALGGYVISDSPKKRQVTLIATGSEVSLAVRAQSLLTEKGISAAVVSMPCAELFLAQSDAYQQAVLGDTPHVIIEAATPLGWHRFIGPKGGTIIGIDTFGASGKGDEVMAHFGFTPEHVADEALKLLK